jgi:hypothetical protein
MCPRPGLLEILDSIQAPKIFPFCAADFKGWFGGFAASHRL